VRARGEAERHPHAAPVAWVRRRRGAVLRHAGPGRGFIAAPPPPPARCEVASWMN